MATVSDGTTTLTPLRVLSPEHVRPSHNIGHDVIGRADQDVTLYPAGLRAGTITFLCADEASAQAIEALHSGAVVITYVPDGLTTLAMTYVLAPDGKIDRTLDTQTLRRWLVAVDFQEVRV
ncbi:hypothetical protein [Humibacter ginsenosidimutans]|uniref:Uncharacterized protein n=1 Tax=Humibacter ginsenosidimutans TaxID=2599293 RepID=A0A5B8M5K9_9MICO|nr:hypothetical protein [Humibacter ginsenosidimutans]QDZ14760.1 hypothetical protein FPZ11_08315 [Humibacter ginsenosidimutans]